MLVHRHTAPGCKTVRRDCRTLVPLSGTAQGRPRKGLVRPFKETLRPANFLNCHNEMVSR
jgi:hypothetical protein